MLKLTISQMIGMMTGLLIIMGIVKSYVHPIMITIHADDLLFSFAIGCLAGMGLIYWMMKHD